jgi:hypothetical protein
MISARLMLLQIIIRFRRLARFSLSLDGENSFPIERAARLLSLPIILGKQGLSNPFLASTVCPQVSGPSVIKRPSCRMRWAPARSAARRNSMPRFFLSRQRQTTSPVRLIRKSLDRDVIGGSHARLAIPPSNYGKTAP